MAQSTDGPCPGRAMPRRKRIRLSQELCYLDEGSLVGMAWGFGRMGDFTFGGNRAIMRERMGKGETICLYRN